MFSKEFSSFANFHKIHSELIFFLISWGQSSIFPEARSEMSAEVGDSADLDEKRLDSVSFQINRQVWYLKIRKSQTFQKDQYFQIAINLNQESIFIRWFFEVSEVNGNQNRL